MAHLKRAQLLHDTLYVTRLNSITFTEWIANYTINQTNILGFRALIISMFVGLFIINLYFRAKVLKSYRYLMQNDIKFSATDILSKSKLEKEILPKYPKHKTEILNFVGLMRRSVMLSIFVILLIAVVGLIFKIAS